jgi:hypothetical protein
MTLTVKFLNEMFRQWGDRIDKPLETYLLATYEEEPFPYEWTEQDLYEQIRKIIYQYEQGILDVNIPSTEERHRIRYESLKESYLKLLHENIRLQELISNAKSLLEASNHLKEIKDNSFPFN